jgi:hypothetical protein
MDATDHAFGAVSTITTLHNEVSNLTPNPGPVANVLDVTKVLIDIIEQTQDSKEQWSFLVERILGFLKNISEESARLNKPIRYGSPAANRLNQLVS